MDPNDASKTDAPVVAGCIPVGETHPWPKVFPAWPKAVANYSCGAPLPGEARYAWHRGVKPLCQLNSNAAELAWGSSLRSRAVDFP